MSSEQQAKNSPPSSTTSCVKFDPRHWPHFANMKPELVDKVNMFYVFGDEGGNVLFTTDDDQVYGCVLVEKDFDRPLFPATQQLRAHEPHLLPELNGKKVIKFAVGSGHVLALAANGDVFGWGSNGARRIGLSNLSDYEKPTQIASDKLPFVSDIACGSTHSLFMASNGEVHASGGVYFPELQKIYDEAASIACGSDSIHVVTKFGTVLSMGSNGCSQLGVSGIASSAELIEAKLPKGSCVVKIACASRYCLALTVTGNVYLWGKLHFGPGAQITMPSLVASSVIDIAADKYRQSSAYISADGNVYVLDADKISDFTLTPFKSLEGAFAFYSQPSITFRPIHAKDSNGVVRSLQLAFNDESTSNLKFRLGEKLVSVHRDILKVRCDYFRNMFSDQWKESSQDIIDIKDYTHAVYSAFLQFLYTDQIPPLVFDDLLSLLDLAICYCEVELRSQCERFIKEEVNGDNAATVFAVADKYECRDLREFSIDFTAKHSTSVFESQAYASLDKKTMVWFSIEISKRMSSLIK